MAAKQTVPENNLSGRNPVFWDFPEGAEHLRLSERYLHVLARRRYDPLPTTKLGRRRLLPVMAVLAWAARQGAKTKRAA